MRGRTHRLAALALVLAGLGLMGSCGGDTPTGPQLRDLVFSPASVRFVGDDRAAMFVLRNVGPRDLGPITIGLDQTVVRTLFPDSLCAGVLAALAPGSVSTLAQGAETNISFTLDLSGVEQALCSPGEYTTNILASVNSQVLGVAAITFDWDGTPP